MGKKHGMGSEKSSIKEQYDFTINIQKPSF